MDVTDLYKSIKHPSEGLYKDKGSKFLSYAFQIESEEEAKILIADLKSKHFNARHHCYGWQLGVEGKEFRINDDGEPSGTAGKPIHGQIRSNSLTNILIVVVRYFGGTKLGTSGLIAAYKEASADAIANAEIIEKTVMDQFTIHFSYAVMNDVMRIIKEEDPQILNQDFDLNCSMVLSIRRSRSEVLISRFEKIDSVTTSCVTGIY
jgi:uncharacterized YigZ family protein